jgi:hypothetical protein
MKAEAARKKEEARIERRAQRAKDKGERLSIRMERRAINEQRRGDNLYDLCRDIPVPPGSSPVRRRVRSARTRSRL